MLQSAMKSNEWATKNLVCKLKADQVGIFLRFIETNLLLEQLADEYNECVEVFKLRPHIFPRYMGLSSQKLLGKILCYV